MSEDNRVEEVLLSLNAEQKQTFIQLVHYIDTQIKEDSALTDIARMLDNLSDTERGTAIEALLKVTWLHYEGSRLAQGGQPAKAYERFTEASEGFRGLGLYKFAFLSGILGKYNRAVIEVQRSNIQQGFDLLTELSKDIENLGPVGQSFRHLVDHAQPEILYTAALVEINRLDFIAARSYVEQTAEASQSVANKYYVIGSPMYNAFYGYSHHYKGAFKLVYSLHCFDRFAWKRVEEQEDGIKELETAIGYLGRADANNHNAQQILKTAQSMHEASQVVQSLVKVTQSILSNTFKTNLQVWADLRQRLQKAVNLASQVGSTAGILQRFYEGLLEKVDNLEEMAKPTRQDFGIYSGLVSALVLIPLFLLLSLINSYTGLSVDSTILFLSSLFLSLVAGFGFGALRFRGLFPQ